MSAFQYRNGQLFADEVDLAEVAAQFGTPTFVYSKAAILGNLTRISDAFQLNDHDICYSVKANSNLGVLSLVADYGASFDIVSAGELARVIRAGGDPGRVVFSGVGKQRWEMDAALTAGIACFNVESVSELYMLNDAAADLKMKAPVSIRVNPAVDAQTHPYIATGLTESKFGIAADEAVSVYQIAQKMDNIEIVGIDCHIGSQITTLGPYLDAYSRLLVLHDELADIGINVRHIDIGGGMGVRYKDETPLDVGELADGLNQMGGGRPIAIKLEPGRSIVAEAGVLLCQVVIRKTNGNKSFAVVDAAMNDLIRPALYQAWQPVWPLAEQPPADTPLDIVGPVCESGDFLALDRHLTLTQGDLIAIGGCGAYSFSMSSNYNTRNRAAEVIVDGDKSLCVRQRETFEDQLRLERTMQEAAS